MCHDIVEVDFEPKSVSDKHEAQEFFLSPIFRGDGAHLVFVAEIEAIKGVEAHRVCSRRSFERRRKPK